jgi:hypothetical protein
MTKDLEVLKERVERLRKLHVRALGSYHALEEMLKFTAPNIVGQDQSHSNAQAARRYAGFFNTARHALSTEVHISLAKIYDDHKDALHIVKLFNYAVGNKKALTSTYKKTLDDPDAAEELAEVYEGLTAEDRQNISNDLDAASDKVRRLKTIRDKIVAHEDLEGPEGIETLSFQDLSDLIDLHDKIINTISRKYYGNAALFEPYKDQVITESQGLLQLIADDYDKFQSQVSAKGRRSAR